MLMPRALYFLPLTLLVVSSFFPQDQAPTKGPSKPQTNLTTIEIG